MFISKCRCCSKFYRTNPANEGSPFNTCCMKRKNKINVQNSSLNSTKQHQVRTFYAIREPSYYWYEVLGSSKEQARGLKRKVSNLLNVVKNELTPKAPDNEASVSLCSRTIPATEVPSKYRKSLKPFVTDSSFIKDSKLMDMPPKPKDYERLIALKELDEVNRVKRQFASSLHVRNVSGMLLRSDGISYYSEKPTFYSSSDLYEVPGLKTDLLKKKVPYKRSIDRQNITNVTDSDTQYSKKTKKEIYFTPKRLRKYPD
ncbi:hypothetical protein ACFFRR_002216 [Megaselia abdita]